MKFSYQIEGMHCAACIEKINSALSPHVNITSITLEPPSLQIESDQEPPLSTLNKHIALAGKYRLQPISVNTVEVPSSSYFPIYLIATYIILIVSINNYHDGSVNWHGWMNQFMAGFFLVFSAFKLLDIRGFANGYATYDLLAKRWFSYGYIYPFLELSLGILYLTVCLPKMTAISTIIIMGFSSLGVINSLLKKQAIQCACLGTLLKVPLSTITLIEDLLMVLMAIISLIIS